MDKEDVVLYTVGFPGGWVVKKAPDNSVDMGLISGPQRLPGEGNGHSLQYSCLGNPHGLRARQATIHGAAKSPTQLSHYKKKKWIPAICDNMHGPWRYYAQWNRWRKTNSTWFHSYVESKKIEQTDQRKKLINTEIRLVVTRGEGMEGKMGKRGQLHSNGWKLDWCWWSLCSVYRCWIIMLYTWNLYNLKRNRKPKNSNLP